MRNFKRFALGISLSCALLLSACSGAAQRLTPVPDGDTEVRQIIPATNEIPQETFGKHTLIAQNEGYSLYLNEEALSVILRENASGRYMRSAVSEVDENDSLMWRNFIRSGVTIEYYAGQATSTTRADMFLKSPEKTVTRTNDGFAAHISYKELELSFDLIVTLNEDGLTAEIPAASITEGENFKLASIYIFPFMGYTFLGEREGYMLIPDGCGALISLEDHGGRFTHPYSAWIYGADLGVVKPSGSVQSYGDMGSTLRAENLVTAPVFGMVHTDAQMGFLGVVEEGKYNAKINAYPNGVVTQYNWISAQFIYRQTYIMPTSQTAGITAVETERGSFDVRVRYLFTSGDEADYSGLAAAYRGYLTEQGVLDGMTEDYRTHLDFFGGDVEEGAIGTSYVAMTTLEQMEAILSDLTEQGVRASLVVYKAWQQGGAYGELKENGKLASPLGTAAQLQSLTEKLREGGTELLLYADLLHLYSTPTDKEDVIYKLNEKRMSQSTGLSIHDTVWFMTPVRSAQLLQSKSDTPLAIDGITRSLYSFRQGENMISRQQAASITGAVMAEKTYAMYAPMDYQWTYTSDYFDFPLYGSNYRYVSGEVPFFAMVLGGSINLYSEYTNFQADRQSWFLRLVELGVRPSFLLTAESSSELMYTDSADLYSTDHAQYEALIASWDAAFSQLHTQARGGITDHYTDGAVAVSTYANGAVVIVNYSNEEVTVEGVRVAGRSFAVKGGSTE